MIRLQETMQMEVGQFESIANIMKVAHDQAKSIINNIR